MDKYIKIEAGVIIVLIILIMIVPNRKLEKFQEASKGYQHTSNVEAINPFPTPGENVDNTTIIYPNRGLGGYTSYKDGTYTWPADQLVATPEENPGEAEDASGDGESTDGAETDGNETEGTTDTEDTADNSSEEI